MKICIVQPNRVTVTETFLTAHAEHLPGDVSVVYGFRPRVEGRSLSLADRLSRAALRARRWLAGQPTDWETTQLFVRVFRQLQPHVVLAQYGPTGVRVMDTCRKTGLPLVVHFHGFDASHYQTIQEHSKTYPRMFAQAAGIVSVSRAMRDKLISLGAPADRVHYNPYGVDLKRIQQANAAAAPPMFLAVGRLIPKKAPDLTIRAFAKVLPSCAEARLRIIGEGELEQPCRRLVVQLGIERAVTFLGAQPQELVLQEMSRARCFVQHSVVSPAGDSEGTPVAIIEASASGLPVVSTRHAGIPDVVVESETGLLVDEHDVDGMAAHLCRIAEQPQLAARLGEAARRRVAEEFSLQRSIQRLSDILSNCVRPTRTRTAA